MRRYRKLSIINYDHYFLLNILPSKKIHAIFSLLKKIYKNFLKNIFINDISMFLYYKLPWKTHNKPISKRELPISYVITGHTLLPFLWILEQSVMQVIRFMQQMYSENIPHKNRNSLNLAWQYLFHYFSKYRSIDKL